MARPNGAMGSPYAGFAEQMKGTAIFGTVGTEQNLKNEEVTLKEVQPTQQTVEAATIASPQFTMDQVSSLIQNLAKIGQIYNANSNGIDVVIGDVKVKITKA